MKKRLALVIMLIVAMISTGLIGIYAAESINPETNIPKVVSPEANEEVVKPNPEQYENEEIKKLINDAENGNITPPSEMNEVVPQKEEKQDAENFPTDNGFNVNLKLYDVLVGPYDIINSAAGVPAYEAPKDKKVTIEFPQLKGHDGADLLIVIFDKNGVMHVVAADEFNPETGEMTFNLPCTGPFFVLQKLPIVVKNIDPDKYPNEELTEVVKSLPENKKIALADFLNASGINEDKLEVEDGVKVNVENYSTASNFADIAISINGKDYDYDLSTKIKAKLFQDINQVDYERILNYANVNYDKAAVKEDKDELANIEPFVLKDSFVYHMDAATGEVSIIYEPEISFNDYDDEEEQALEAAENNSEEKTSSVGLFSEVFAAESSLAVDMEKVQVWDVEDVDSVNKDHVSICINGDEYIGMGPFILFMPNKHPFPWWIVILAAALIILIYAVNKNKKKNKTTKVTENKTAEDIKASEEVKKAEGIKVSEEAVKSV